eukprot:scaffold117291_cov42-Phaeocystis_antarctica.AAC.1
MGPAGPRCWRRASAAACTSAGPQGGGHRSAAPAAGRPREPRRRRRHRRRRSPCHPPPPPPKQRAGPRPCCRGGKGSEASRGWSPVRGGPVRGSRRRRSLVRQVVEVESRLPALQAAPPVHGAHEAQLRIDLRIELRISSRISSNKGGRDRTWQPGRRPYVALRSA